MTSRELRPIRVSANRRFLVRPDGTPFFWLGDTAWQLFHRLDRDETDRYLADRAARGFTVIQAVAHGRIHGEWWAEPNAFGDAPFEDADLLRPNEAFFAHVEWALDRARSHGLIPALLPVWSVDAVPKGILHLANARAYGEWIGARFAAQEPVWVLGGDICPVWYGEHEGFIPPESAELVDHRPVYDALAAGILSAAGQDSFLTYHPSPHTPLGAPDARTSAHFGDRDWLALNMIEWGQGDLGDVDEVGARVVAHGRFRSLSGPSNHRTIAAEYRSTPIRPVVDGETRYEDHPVVEDGAPAGARSRLWSAYHARSGAYHALFAGAAGHTYGHVSLWDLHRDDGVANSWVPPDVTRVEWPEALSAPGGDQMRHAKALLLSRPYLSRVPDDGVVDARPVYGDDHVTATRDLDRSWAMVYLPRGGAVRIVANAVSAAEAVGWWYDPRTGEATAIPGRVDPTGPLEFTAPSAGPEEDWILVLDDAERGFPAPGTPAG